MPSPFIIKIFSTKRKLTKFMLSQLDRASIEEVEEALASGKPIYRSNALDLPNYLFEVEGTPNFKRYQDSIPFDASEEVKSRRINLLDRLKEASKDNLLIL